MGQGGFLFRTSFLNATRKPPVPAKKSIVFINFVYLHKKKGQKPLGN